MHYIYIYYFGSIKDNAIQTLLIDISKRVQNLKLIELQVPKGSLKNKRVEEIQQLEKEVLFSKVFEKHSCVGVCTEKGLQFTSFELYQYVKKIDSEIALIISGPYGPHKDIIQKATFNLSLSKLTFTHEMALYLLVEQLYRVQCFENNVGYTK